jgi:SagB-type dehydrogenase family enzyme
MKRLTILILIAAGFAVICFGQYSSRSLPRKIYQLAEPRPTGPLSLEEALAKQRIVRKFTNQQLKNTEIGQLAWAGANITEQQTALPTTSSSESGSPVELYLATQDGVFVYRPEQHSMEQLDEQDVRNTLMVAASMQQAILDAPCDIIVTGSSKRLSEQFKNDARKYMLLQAGHAAQNIQLQAVSLGLGSVTIGGFNTRDVSKTCKVPREMEPVYIISVGYPVTEQPALPAATEQTDTRVKRAVLIAASRDFHEEELFQTIRILEETGVRTMVASTRTGIIRGLIQNTAEARLSLNQLRVDDYDAVIFIGGPGVIIEFYNNPTALNIVREAAAKGKVLAAMDFSPVVLANAGVLNGVRVTSLPSEQARLIQAGAVYTGTLVERSGLIITANGPMSVVTFAQAVANAIAGK